MELSAQAGSAMEYVSSDAGMGNPIKGFPNGPAKAGPQKRQGSFFSTLPVRVLKFIFA